MAHKHFLFVRPCKSVLLRSILENIDESHTNKDHTILFKSFTFDCAP